MKTFTYAKADSADAAVRDAHSSGAKFIAGGTNLLDLMKLQIETPEKLVDISRLPLGEIEEREDGGLTIGALVPNSDLAADPRVIAKYEVLSRALLAGASGQFELNVMKPLVAHLMLQSARLLDDAMRSFEMHCVRGIEPRRERLARSVERSPMLATALVPHVGYDAASRVVHHALEHGCPLRESAAALQIASREEFDAWVDARRMAGDGSGAPVDRS